MDFKNTSLTHRGKDLIDESQVQKSITYNSTDKKVELQGDSISPGNNKYYGTNENGEKGFYNFAGFSTIPNIEIITSNTNVTDNNFIILVDATNNDIIINLQTPDTRKSLLIIKRIDSSSNCVTIDAGSGFLIDKEQTLIITSQWSCVNLAAHGESYYII